MHVSTYHLRNYRSIGPVGVRVDLQQEFVALLGVNNSGKSSVLRSFHELRPIFVHLSRVNPGELDDFLGEDGSFEVSPDVPPGQRIWSAHTSSSEPSLTLDLVDYESDEDFESVSRISVHLTAKKTVRLVLETSESGQIAPARKVSLLARGGGRGAYVRITTHDQRNHALLWEPVALAFQELANAMYIGPFRNAINAGGGNSYYDLSTGTNFVAAFAAMKSGPVFESNEAISRMSSKLAQIFNLKSLEVGTSPNHEELTFNVDGRSFRASELGAGLSQFVIVAASVLTRQPSILLVDEPEANLHASLQGAFLALLAERVDGPVVFASHSLGLARSVADEVVVVSRSRDGVSRGESWSAVKSLAAVLGELGYGGLNDSKFKAVLLVEGVTEVRLFGELLAKFGIRNDVVVVPLGGDTMATGNRQQELAELSRLSDRLFAFVDSESVAPGAGPAVRRKEFLATCASLGIDAQASELRSIENYLDQSVARDVLKVPNAIDFGPYDKPGSDWSWSKSKNWRIARDMQLRTLEGSDLYQFMINVRDSIK